MNSAPQLIVLMIEDIHVRVTVNARRAPRSAETDPCSLRESVARSSRCPLCALTVEMLRITSKATPSASVCAAENRIDASVTGLDRTTISQMKIAVKTATMRPTGQATTSSTTMAASTPTTMRNIPQLSSSIACINAQEKVDRVEETSPEGWSTCQR